MIYSQHRQNFRVCGGQQTRAHSARGNLITPLYSTPVTSQEAVDTPGILFGLVSIDLPVAAFWYEGRTTSLAA